jgi:transcriptional regulator with XRE-family HTH domain
MWGDDIRRARLAARLTVTALAKLSEVSRKQITLIEQNKNVSMDTLAKLAPHLPALRSLTLTQSRHVSTPKSANETEIDVDSAHRVLRQLRSGVSAMEKILKGEDPGILNGEGPVDREKTEPSSVADVMKRLAADVSSLPPEKLLEFFSDMAERVSQSAADESSPLRLPRNRKRLHSAVGRVITFSKLPRKNR